MTRKLYLALALLAGSMIAMPAPAHEAGTWIVRAGGGAVSPDSNNLFLETSELEDGTVVNNTYLQVDDAASLVLSATYMLYEHWGIDILASAPFEHDLDITGTVDGSRVSIPVGSVQHLPPTISLQYHFAPEAAFQPYVGFGVNYTIFFSEDLTSNAADLAIVGIELKDSSGIALQVGADWVFGQKWLVNIDARYIQIEPQLDITADLDGDVVTFSVPGRVEINPFVYSLSVGYRF